VTGTGEISAGRRSVRASTFPVGARYSVAVISFLDCLTPLDLA